MEKDELGKEFLMSVQVLLDRVEMLEKENAELKQMIRALLDAYSHDTKLIEKLVYAHEQIGL